MRAKRRTKGPPGPRRRRRDRAEQAGWRAARPLGTKGTRDCFPETPRAGYLKVSKRIFAHLCRLGVGAGVASSKYINYQAKANTTPEENKTSWKTEKVIPARVAGPQAAFRAVTTAAAERAGPETRETGGTGQDANETDAHSSPSKKGTKRILLEAELWVGGGERQVVRNCSALLNICSEIRR